MGDEKLLVRVPDPRRDRDEMYDLIAKAFSHEGYFRFRDICRDSYIGHSHYDWAASRIGLIGGRMVTHWGVWGYPMRIGSARVRVAGIGAVATHGDCRKRGLMAETIRHALEAMRAEGYDMTILFGLPNFYDKFGYVRAWNETTWTVSAGDLPTERPAAKLARFNANRRSAEVDELYNRGSARLTGTAIRPTYTRRWCGPDSGYLWRDGRGRLAGYVAFKQSAERVTCIEAGGNVEEILRVFGWLARRGHCSEVRLPHLHHDGELCRRLRRGTCRMERTFHKSGAAMVHTLDLGSALAKMTRELSRRLRRSALAGWRGRLGVIREAPVG